MGDSIVSFHDLSDDDGPLAGVVDDGAAEDFSTKTFMIDEDQRNTAVSLLNMAVARHARRCGLVIDNSKFIRFIFFRLATVARTSSIGGRIKTERRGGWQNQCSGMGGRYSGVTSAPT